MKKFWQRRSVLITGAGGFVGRHLAYRLAKEGAKVTAFSKSKVNFSGLRITEELGSITNFDLVKKIIKQNSIDTIFHLAAQPLVELGQTSPKETFEVNVQGTWNILEAARLANVQKIIIASTVHVYGDNPELPFKEEYFPQPSRPYETSKACADLLAQSFADTYNLQVEIPRFVNIYGPGDLNFSRLVPKTIREILKGENPKIWDMGTIRDFLYIDDAVDAYLLLAEKDLPNTKRSRVFNFGTGKPIKIVDLVEKIIAVSKNKRIKLKKEEPPVDRRDEVKKQYVSTEKANEVLGWFPKVNLDKGLENTINWYKTSGPV